MPIISSLLDTDFYKLTMMQAVIHQFPDVTAEYRFQCRTPQVSFHLIQPDFEAELQHLCQLSFTEQEIEYLQQTKVFKSDFLGHLRSFHLDLNFIHFHFSRDELSMQIRGLWWKTILFEVPILAIINELYFRSLTTTYDLNDVHIHAWHRFLVKMDRVRQSDPNFGFVDFGTRRRFSNAWQSRIISYLAHSSDLKLQFLGTSNVYFAFLNQIAPIGTMAHEWLQAGQVLSSELKNCQTLMLQRWLQEYGNLLSIAISDVLGIDAFLADFSMELAQQYQGVRQDSGDPVIVARKIIDHYRSLGIDPRSKTLVFSDGLDFPTAIHLHQLFKKEIRPIFGIGTNLMNDMPGLTPLQIVIKMTYCNGHPVAKITDSPDKLVSEDAQFLEILRRLITEKQGGHQ